MRHIPGKRSETSKHATGHDCTNDCMPLSAETHSNLGASSRHQVARGANNNESCLAFMNSHNLFKAGAPRHYTSRAAS